MQGAALLCLSIGSVLLSASFLLAPPTCSFASRRMFGGYVTRVTTALSPAQPPSERGRPGPSLGRHAGTGSARDAFLSQYKQ